MRGRGRLLAYANYRSRQKVYRAEICIMRCCESVFTEGGTAVKEVVDVHDVCHVETGRIGDVKGPPLRRSFACQ